VDVFWPLDLFKFCKITDSVSKMGKVEVVQDRGIVAMEILNLIENICGHRLTLMSVTLKVTFAV